MDDLQETDDDHWPTDEIRALVALTGAQRERERLADLDHFDPDRTQTDRYDRRPDEEGYGR